MPTKRAASTKGTPRIKNYLSSASETSIFEAIRKQLATHKAKRIMFDYDDDGRATSIQFSVEVGGNTLLFKLPARLENVEDLVRQSYKAAGRGISGEALRDQAYRTAWANIRDWVAAQMALIDSGMVRTEEVFLPYLVVAEGKTLFEEFAERRALPSPRTVITEEQ